MLHTARARRSCEHLRFLAVWEPRRVLRLRCGRQYCAGAYPALVSHSPMIGHTAVHTGWQLLSAQGPWHLMPDVRMPRRCGARTAIKLPRKPCQWLRLWQPGTAGGRRLPACLQPVQKSRLPRRRRLDRVEQQEQIPAPPALHEGSSLSVNRFRTARPRVLSALWCDWPLHPNHALLSYLTGLAGSQRVVRNRGRGEGSRHGCWCKGAAAVSLVV